MHQDNTARCGAHEHRDGASLTHPIHTMAFDLKTLKDKIDATLFAEIESAFNELSGQRDAARAESINGRKTMKTENEKFKADLAQALEKLGIDSADDLATLPDSKGQADALKQYEVQLRRSQRERDEAKLALTDIQGTVTASRREAAIAQAIASQPFQDAELARDYITARIRQEGDEFLFDVGAAGASKLVPVTDGAAWVAATKPLLMPAPGNGATGSGFKVGMGHNNAPGNTGEPTLDMTAIYAARMPQAAATAA